jgi:hypothetical protein
MCLRSYHKEHNKNIHNSNLKNGAFLAPFFNQSININHQSSYICALVFSNRRSMQNCIFTFIIFIYLLLLVSCNNREQKSHETMPPSTDLKLAEPDLTTLDQWLAFHDLSLAHFDTLPKDKAMFLSMEPQDQSSLDLYQDFFIFSPDSTKYIDLDSYSLVIEKSNGRLRLLGSEPDTEVAVVNLHESSRTRILFCGPACLPEEALWINNEVLYILGQADETGNQYLPFIYAYDLKRETVLRYNSTKPGKLPNQYFEKVRMKGVFHDSPL